MVVFVDPIIADPLLLTKVVKSKKKICGYTFQVKAFHERTNQEMANFTLMNNCIGHFLAKKVGRCAELTSVKLLISFVQR